MSCTCTCTYLEIVIEISKLDDDVTGNDWKGKVDLKTETKYMHQHSVTEKIHMEKIIVVKFTLTSPCAAVREQLLAVSQVLLLQSW